MSRVVLAYGWYGRGNAGDELMKRALIGLFAPRGVELRFVNTIDTGVLRSKASGELVDGIIFGGGSILDGEPNIKAAAFDMLVNGALPVFYVGIGPETAVVPTHRALLNVARVVAYRDKDIPDLVYSLSTPALANKPTRGVLIVPNVEVVPVTESPHWMHVAWEQHKNEFAQALDELIDNGSGIVPEFLLMCKNDRMDDAWPASELIARMRRRAWKKEFHRATDDLSTCEMMSRFRVVITQRYHGIILAEMAGVPYVALEHHDKLKNATPSRGKHVSYYGAHKALLKSVISDAANGPRFEPHHAEREVYDRLVDNIVEQLGWCHG